MAVSFDISVQSALEDEFCRTCGITVSWTSEEWVHDYTPEDDHQPVVPHDPYEEDLYAL